MKVKQDREVWEKEYGSGAWDWLSSTSEFAHYSMVAAYVQMRKSPASLLDLGCGEGVFLRYLDENLLSEYTGVDIAQSALDRIHPKRTSDRYICSSLEAYRPDRKWDVILFNEVLYFMYSPVALLTKFENCLNPEGYIVISMHQKTNPFCDNNRCLRKVLKHLGQAKYEVIDNVEIDNGTRWNILTYRVPAAQA